MTNATPTLTLAQAKKLTKAQLIDHLVKSGLPEVQEHTGWTKAQLIELLDWAGDDTTEPAPEAAPVVEAPAAATIGALPELLKGMDVQGVEPVAATETVADVPKISRDEAARNVRIEAAATVAAAAAEGRKLTAAQRRQLGQEIHVAVRATLDNLRASGTLSLEGIDADLAEATVAAWLSYIPFVDAPTS